MFEQFTSTARLICQQEAKLSLW